MDRGGVDHRAETVLAVDLCTLDVRRPHSRVIRPRSTIDPSAGASIDRRTAAGFDPRRSQRVSRAQGPDRPPSPPRCTNRPLPHEGTRPPFPPDVLVASHRAGLTEIAVTGAREAG